MKPGIVRRSLAYVAQFPSLVRSVRAADSTQRALARAPRTHLVLSPHAHSLAVEAVESTFHLGLFGTIVDAIRQRTEVSTQGLFTRSLSIGESHSLPRLVNARLIVGRLMLSSWRRLYARIVDTEAYASTAGRPLSDAIDYFLALRTRRELRSRSDLLGLRIRGVPVGDLVNDSFLRFHPAATLDYRDQGLLMPIWQAYRDVRRAKAYFSHRRPCLYLASSTAYIQHGVPARVALQMGIPVLSFGSFQEFAKRLSLVDWLDTKNADMYATDFDSLSDPEQKVAAAESALMHRLSGGIDGATGYMERSAYAEYCEDPPDVGGAVVVFLHDFYDSPHIYYDLVFPDFWTWICFTIETLERTGSKFVVKPHPNQIPLSKRSLETLKQLYPAVEFLPDGVSNKHLVDGGMVCAVTVYGTVAHEMAFLGIPTIACARHPHIGFGFCRTARTKAEYASLLANPGPAGFDAKTAREESLRFYHMHNSNLPPAETALRDATLDVRRQCTFEDPSRPALADQFADLAKLPAFISFIDECVAHLLQAPES